MRQTTDIPDPDPEPDPESRRRGPAGRRRLGLAAVAVAVVVTGAVPLAWGAFSGGSGSGSGSGAEPRPRSEALMGPARTAPVADFDDDGAQDVYTTGENGGAVSVVYGAEAGKQGEKGEKERARRLDLDSPGVPGAEGDGVSFGDVAVARDLDGDGHTDLAASVEVWKKDRPEGTHGGLVVLWGSPKGLSGGSYLKGVPEKYLRTGLADDPLVAGDMTGDGHTDLVLRIGSKRGLLKGPFDRDGASSGTAPVPAPFSDVNHDNELVTAFAADLNGDGADDLISSHATEDDGMGGGKVETSYAAGGPKGFRKPDTESLPGINTSTTGDVDKDGYTDVILRRYPKGVSPESAASAPVEVFHGSESGPDPSRHSELDQDSPGVPGRKDRYTQFASALDAGDADGDGYADVAVSTPVDTDDDAKGTVTVLRGGSKGLTGSGAGVVEEPPSPDKESGDEGSGDESSDDSTDAGTRFGNAVRMGDTNGDGRADLAIGAPRTGDYEGALWIYPARNAPKEPKDGEREWEWPGDAARSYGPRDFGDPKAPDDEQIGSNVR